MLSLFARNAQRLPLSPQERAFLAFFWHLILSSIANGIFAASQAVFLYITIHGTLGLSTFQWWPVVGLQIWNVVTAILVGLRKYVTAHADMAYAGAIGGVIDQAE